MEATALNRADVVQRKGNYPPPKGVTDIIGLECAGYLLNSPSELLDKSYTRNQRVMALLPGGGYASVAKAQRGEVLPIPASLSFEEAAAIPETWVTAFQLLHWIGKVQKGDFVLVHAGASGVGTSALQLIRDAQAKGIAVCSTAAKLEACQKLGAHCGINYKESKEFAREVLSGRVTAGHGADIILDCVCGSHFEQNLAALADEGRWVIYAFMGGSKVPNPKLPNLFAKRATLAFSSLRMRSQQYRNQLVQDFARTILPKFENRSLKPVVDKIYAMSQVVEAHKYMESNQNVGKIVLRNDLV